MRLYQLTFIYDCNYSNNHDIYRANKVGILNARCSSLYDLNTTLSNKSKFYV